MKISGRKSVSGIGSVKSSSKNDAITKEQQQGVEKDTDAVEISASSKGVDSAREAIQGMPDVRTEKVGEIKPLVDDGSYNVPSEKIAKNMVDQSLRESAMLKKRGK